MWWATIASILLDSIRAHERGLECQGQICGNVPCQLETKSFKCRLKYFECRCQAKFWPKRRMSDEKMGQCRMSE